MLWNHRLKNWVGVFFQPTYVIGQMLRRDPPDHYRCRARRKKKKNSRIHGSFYRLHLDYLSSWKYIIGICRGFHVSWIHFFSKMLSDIRVDVIWFYCDILLHKNIFVSPVSEKTSEKLNTVGSGPATFHIGSKHTFKPIGPTPASLATRFSNPDKLSDFGTTVIEVISRLCQRHLFDFS